MDRLTWAVHLEIDLKVHQQMAADQELPDTKILRMSESNNVQPKDKRLLYYEYTTYFVWICG